MGNNRRHSGHTGHDLNHQKVVSKLKRLCSFLLAALLWSSLLVTSASADRDQGSGSAPEISAECAIVLEPLTGTVLYEKAADQRMLIASTTKIMTAMVVLEHCALNEQVRVTSAHAGVEGSSMYLEAGDYYTVEDLLYGLMLASGNDAAAALADHVAGSMEGFAALMNEKAEALGLTGSHFANAHGLDAKGHYSCARDLARITAAAMEDPLFRRFFSTKERTVHGHDFQNHNRLLWTLEGCVGGKTGYTQNAGRILVSVTEREGMRLICVTLCDPDDWADHAYLMNSLFAAWRLVPLPEDRWSRLETLSGSQDYVRLRCAAPAVLVPKDSALRLEARLPRFVFAPVTLGDRAGSLTVLLDGETAQELPVYYGETVSLDPSVALSAWERFQRSWLMPGKVYYLSK